MTREEILILHYEGVNTGMNVYHIEYISSIIYSMYNTYRDVFICE